MSVGFDSFDDDEEGVDCGLDLTGLSEHRGCVQAAGGWIGNGWDMSDCLLLK